MRELGDETLKKIAHELTENLRQNVSVDWSVRDSVRAKLRLMVKRILRKYKYPPDQQEEAAVQLVQQAEQLSAGGLPDGQKSVSWFKEAVRSARKAKGAELGVSAVAGQGQALRSRTTYGRRR